MKTEMECCMKLFNVARLVSIVMFTTLIGGLVNRALAQNIPMVNYGTSDRYLFYDPSQCETDLYATDHPTHVF